MQIINEIDIYVIITQYLKHLQDILNFVENVINVNPNTADVVHCNDKHTVVSDNVRCQVDVSWNCSVLITAYALASVRGREISALISKIKYTQTNVILQ